MACFSFILTEKCDWDCDYCQFPLLYEPNELTTEKVVTHTQYIRDIISQTEYPYIEIQGGEVGLIGPHMLSLFLSELGYKVNVSTNGLFLERGYHLNDGIRPYIKEIQWHVCSRPGDYENPVDYNDDDIFINKGIVHDNIDDIAKFISRNSHIRFNYVELECDITEKRSHRIDDYRRLYEAISSMQNVTENALSVIEKRINTEESKRDKCKYHHGVVSINLADESICLCQRAIHVKIPLTKENLIKRLQAFPSHVFDYPERVMGCDSCIRLCSGKYEFNVKEHLKLRRCNFNES